MKNTVFVAYLIASVSMILTAITVTVAVGWHLYQLGGVMALGVVVLGYFWFPGIRKIDRLNQVDTNT